MSVGTKAKRERVPMLGPSECRGKRYWGGGGVERWGEDELGFRFCNRKGERERCPVVLEEKGGDGIGNQTQEPLLAACGGAVATQLSGEHSTRDVMS